MIVTLGEARISMTSDIGAAPEKV